MDRHAPSASRWGTATGARQSSLRSLNLATVVRTLYASPTPPSRADLASATGLTRSTVSRLVDELIAHGLVRELDPVFGGMRGRPAVPLAPARGTWLGLGLEVNISHVAARLVDLAGRIVAYRDQVGTITSVEQLDEVPGIGATLVQRIAQGVCP